MFFFVQNHQSVGHPGVRPGKGYPDALHVFKEGFFRPSANFPFTKQKGIAPRWGAAYPFIKILLEVGVGLFQNFPNYLN